MPLDGPPTTPESSNDARDDAAAEESARTAPTSLESLLMRFRLITPNQLDEAMREKVETGRDIGAIVVERGWVNEDQLSRLVSYAPALAGSFAAQTSEAPAVAAVPESEPQVEAEPELEPEPEAQVTSIVPFGSAAPQPEPFAEPMEASAPSFDPEPPLILDEPPLTPVAAEPLADADPVAEAEPVADADPVAEAEPAFEAETPFEAEAAFQAEPAFEAEPALEAEPVAPVEPEAPAPEPVAAAEPVEAPAPAAPAPQQVQFVEPAPVETIARVFVKLENGERVEVGSFDDIARAKARAEEVVGEIVGAEGWPFFSGRFIRPETIVSVDVDATVVRYS